MNRYWIETGTRGMVTKSRLEAVVALLDEILFLTIIIIIIIYLLYNYKVINLFEATIILSLYAMIASYITYKLYKVQTSSATVGPESMIGKQGIVIEPLNPEGLIEVEGELWKAVSKNGRQINPGERVRVADHIGLTLVVEREQNND